jgi:hypothetical protein
VSGAAMDKADKPKRSYSTNKIRSLPSEVRKELDRRIAERNFASYRELKVWLVDHGCRIGYVSVRRYAVKLEQKLEAVRMATEQARAVVEATDGDDVDFNQALLRLIQQHLFTVLVELNGAELTRVNLPALARSVAALGRASILQQKFTTEMKAKIGEKIAAARKTVEEAETRGLTDEGVAQIKRVLMEITE